VPYESVLFQGFFKNEGAGCQIISNFMAANLARNHLFLLLGWYLPGYVINHVFEPGVFD
jgi:hypothetical protein